MSGELTIQRFELGPFLANCYLLIGPSGRKAAVVDPGFDAETVLDRIQDAGLELEWIVNTHGHLDHVAGNHLFKERTGAPIVIHPADEPMLAAVSRQGMMFGVQAEDSPPGDLHFAEGEPFLFDGLSFDVIHTPGHSPGGVCLLHGDQLIVGDTLFAGSIGRTDLPGGSLPELVASIRDKLFALPGPTTCWPGHGPPTTLAEEKASNPFVGDAAIARFGQEIR